MFPVLFPHWVLSDCHGDSGASMFNVLREYGVHRHVFNAVAACSLSGGLCVQFRTSNKKQKIKSTLSDNLLDTYICSNSLLVLSEIISAFE